MLTKIPDEPPVGQMRVTPFFSFKRRHTADGYVAYWHTVYAVDVWEVKLRDKNGIGGEWTTSKIYASKDNADIYVNMVSLAKKELRDNPLPTHGTTTTISGASGYVTGTTMANYNNAMISYTDTINHMMNKYPPAAPVIMGNIIGNITK